MTQFAKMFVTIAAALATTLSLACSNEPDVRQRASDALERANIEHVNLDWDDDARVLHLKGTVESAQMRERAEQVVTSAVGSSARVLNELMVEGVDEATADDRDGSIRDALNAEIENDPMLRERNINFDVNNGMVTVTGEVHSAEEKSRVAEMARKTAGVKDVANALDVMPQRRR